MTVFAILFALTTTSFVSSGLADTSGGGSTKVQPVAYTTKVSLTASPFKPFATTASRHWAMARSASAGKPKRHHHKKKHHAAHRAHRAVVLSPIELGRQLNAKFFGSQYWSSLYQLWMHESNWNPDEWYGNACGIPQALPCSKIRDRSVRGQILWGLNYIRGRYGNPAGAWQHWLAHNWY